jgi:CheY-like chemotaxis protein
VDFFSHNITNALVQFPGISRSKLYKETGIDTKRSFLEQIQQLQEEGHLTIQGNRYLLRTYKLSVVLSGICIETINLPYIPAKELAQHLNFPINTSHTIEDDFDFQLTIAGVAIVAKDKDVMERLYQVKLDLEKYQYILSAEYVDPHWEEDNEEHLQGINIVYLDDHPVISGGLKHLMQRDYFPDSNWFYFTHPDQALEFIKQMRDTGLKISFILTDVLHLGMDGVEFAKAVAEMYNGTHHPPVVGLSFVSSQDPRVVAGLEEGAFLRYFSKAEDPRALGCYLKSLLKPSPRLATSETD